MHARDYQLSFSSEMLCRGIAICSMTLPFTTSTHSGELSSSKPSLAFNSAY